MNKNPKAELVPLGPFLTPSYAYLVFIANQVSCLFIEHYTEPLRLGWQQDVMHFLPLNGRRAEDLVGILEVFSTPNPFIRHIEMKFNVGFTDNSMEWVFQKGDMFEDTNSLIKSFSPHFQVKPRRKHQPFESNFKAFVPSTETLRDTFKKNIWKLKNP